MKLTTPLKVAEMFGRDQLQKITKIKEHIREQLTETETLRERFTLYEILLAGNELYDNGEQIDKIIHTTCIFNYEGGIIRLTKFEDEVVQTTGVGTIKSDSVRDKVFRELTEAQKLNMNGKKIWIVIARCETVTNGKTWRCIDYTHTRRMANEA